MEILKYGNNALLINRKHNAADKEYHILCAVDYKDYLGCALYDIEKSIEFTVTENAPQEVKDKLLELAKEYIEKLK